MLTVPKFAIECFERASRTKVSAYSSSPLFTAALRWRIHDFRPCGETKRSLHAECQAFDCRDARRSAWRYPVGGVKICHSGLLEWFVPLFHDRQLLCFLTAGLRRPPRRMPSDIPLISAVPLLTPVSAAEVPETTEDEVRNVMELMRMLAARLTLWHDEMMAADFRESEMPRADIIRCLIEREGCRGLDLAALARFLHLTPSRTAHLVREETGASFTDLLRRSRTGFALTLLRDTALPIQEVAKRSGFGSAAQFHRAFRREFSLTPLAYRKQLQSRGA